MNSLSLVGQRKDISKSRLMEETAPDSSSDDKVSKRSLLMNAWRKSSRKLNNSCRNLLGSDQKKNKGKLATRTESPECTTQRNSEKWKDECESVTDHIECAKTSGERRKSLSSSKPSSCPKSNGEKIRTLTPFRRRKTMTNAEHYNPISYESPKSKDQENDDAVSPRGDEGYVTPSRNKTSTQRSHSREESGVAHGSSTKKRSITPYRKGGESSERETESLTPPELSESLRDHSSRKCFQKQKSRSRLQHAKSSRLSPSRMHSSSSELSYDTKGVSPDVKSSSDLNYMHTGRNDCHAMSSIDMGLNLQADDCLNASLTVLNLHADQDRHAMNDSRNFEEGNISYSDGLNCRNDKKRCHHLNSSNELNFHRAEKGHHHSKSSNELRYRHAEKGRRHTKSSSDLKYDHGEAKARVTKTFPRVTKTYGAGPVNEKLGREQQTRVFRDGNGSTRKLEYSFVKQKSYRGIEVKPRDSTNDDDCGIDDTAQKDEATGVNSEEVKQSERISLPHEKDDVMYSCRDLEISPEDKRLDECTKDEKEEVSESDEAFTRSELMNKVRGKGSVRRLLSSFGTKRSQRGPEATSDHVFVDQCTVDDIPIARDNGTPQDGDLGRSSVSTSDTKIPGEASESDPATKSSVRAEIEKIEEKIIRSKSCRNLGMKEPSNDYLCGSCSRLETTNVHLYRPTLTKSVSMGRLGNRSFLSGNLTGSQKSNMVAAHASIIPSVPMVSRKRSSIAHRSQGYDLETENCQSSNSPEDKIDTQVARSLSTGRAPRLVASRNRSQQSRNSRRPPPVACTRN